MKLKEKPADSIGCAIAQRLVNSLIGNGIVYHRLVDIIYKELRDIAEEQRNGDWLELPGGHTYTKTFSVGKVRK
jgi:hypothetical protein